MTKIADTSSRKTWLSAGLILALVAGIGLAVFWDGSDIDSSEVAAAPTATVAEVPQTTIDAEVLAEFVLWLKQPVGDVSECSGDDTGLRLQCEDRVAEYETNKASLGEKLVEFEGVESVVLRDQEQTFEEFREYYEDQPQIMELVSQEDMPESFEIKVRSSSDRIYEDFRDSYADQIGVREISSVDEAALEKLGDIQWQE